MKILSKVLVTLGICLAVLIIFNLWLLHAKDIEVKKVSNLLQSSPQWNRVHVRGAGGWRIVIEGVVSNEMQLQELRTELRKIEAHKTAVFVKAQE